jgi:hypothetical protein
MVPLRPPTDRNLMDHRHPKPLEDDGMGDYTH